MNDLDADGEGPESPRRKRPLRRGALGCLLALGILALVIWFAATQIRRDGEEKLAATLSRVETAEPDWTAAAIEREREQRLRLLDPNSATVVLRIARQIPESWTKWRNATDRLPGEISPTPLPEDRAASVRSQAAETESVRRLALTLRDLPNGQFPFRFPENPLALSLPHVDDTSRVSSLCEYEAALAGADGDHNRALGAAHAALNASRAIGDEPTMVSQLFRMRLRSVAAELAQRVLSQGTPTNGLHALQAAFFADAEEPLYLHGVRGERAGMHMLFTGLRERRLSVEMALPAEGRPAVLHPGVFEAYRPFLPADHAEYLRIMTAHVGVARLPWHEQRSAVRAVLPDGPPTAANLSITRFLLPACRKIVDEGLRSRARLLTAATGLACERFRQQNGRWPRDLNEIPKEILAEVPQGPFDATPLRYRVYADRIAIWCVEEDANAPRPTLPDFALPNDRAVGHGVRLWNPEVRGQPLKP